MDCCLKMGSTIDRALITKENEVGKNIAKKNTKKKKQNKTQGISMVDTRGTWICPQLAKEMHEQNVTPKSNGSAALHPTYLKQAHESLRVRRPREPTISNLLKRIRIYFPPPLVFSPNVHR